MAEPTREPITGTITAESSKNDSPTVLRWESNAELSEVYVCEEDGPETLVSATASGVLEITWIQPGRTYLFRLYDSKAPRRVLAETKLIDEARGTLSLHSSKEAPDDESRAMLTWEISPSVTAEICLSEEGAEERTVCRGASGEFELAGLKAGTEYLFNLYADQRNRQLLDSVEFYLEAKGKLAIQPSQEASDDESRATLTWEVSASTTAEICLSEEGGEERAVCRGASGEFELAGLKAGTEYVFRLYSDQLNRQLLDSVKFYLEPRGTLSIHPNKDDSDNESRVTLQWEISASTTAEICLSEEGGEERTVCRGASGEFELVGLKAGTEYLFNLYADQRNRQLLDSVKFQLEVKGMIWATPNPLPLESRGKTLLRWETNSPTGAEIWVSDFAGNETLVCRGSSGSFEVGGLRLGIEYIFRLYGLSPARRVLDEVEVRLSDIPWSYLLDRLRGASGGKDYTPEWAEFIAETLAQGVHHPGYAEWFRLWEERGVHVTPVHFYEPIPELRTLDDKLWSEPQRLCGIEMNPARQSHFLRDVFPAFRKEYEQIPIDNPEQNDSFYLANGRFEGLDPLLAYCMVRHFRPSQIVEVGSGYSTLILAQAARVNGETELHSIEPFPVDFLTAGVPGLTSLLVSKVEEVDPSFFSRLTAGDFLFIDTSHVVRIGGDVNYLFLEVLPRLNPGVIVHVHDIFFPYEYPQDWVMERRRFWTEQYLLQAFLVFNSEFEVLVSSGYLKATYPEEVAEVFPAAAPWTGGSFWMKRKEKK